MKAMLELIEQGEMGPGDMVEKGELLRLLGRFDEAVAVLNLVKPDGHSEVRASKVQWFAQSQFAELRML